MRIALDYDKTYDADPELWDDFIRLAEVMGHEVVLLTYRDAVKDWTPLLEHLVKVMGIKVYCTGGVAKGWYSAHFGPGTIDIWIDDRPQAILENSPLTPEQLEHWRKEQNELRNSGTTV